MDIICSKDFARRRKQRGRPHCMSVQWFKSHGLRALPSQRQESDPAPSAKPSGAQKARLKTAGMRHPKSPQCNQGAPPAIRVQVLSNAVTVQVKSARSSMSGYATYQALGLSHIDCGLNFQHISHRPRRSKAYTRSLSHRGSRVTGVANLYLRTVVDWL